MPPILPSPDENGNYYIKGPNGSHNLLRLDGQLTQELEKFIKQNGNHIAAVVVVDVKTDSIIAMAQGQHPFTWNSNSHSALYEGFPAASLFKTVPTTAALDLIDIDPDEQVNLWGGCAKVNANGMWLSDTSSRQLHQITLRRAFASSCNSFYAKMAITHLGLGIINSYATRLGWGQVIQTDFHLNPSPILLPEPAASSLQTVGKFSAGFGMVGMSAIHAAWIYNAISKNGLASQLRIFQKTPSMLPDLRNRVFKEETGPKLRDIMNRTILSGTAASVFRKRNYRHLIPLVGGKTGTLTGKAPKGLTTWFVGMMPYQNPEVVVAAVVVTDNRWVIKGPHLAAEAFRLWYKQKSNDKRLSKVINTSQG